MGRGVRRIRIRMMSVCRGTPIVQRVGQAGKEVRRIRRRLLPSVGLVEMEGRQRSRKVEMEPGLGPREGVRRCRLRAERRGGGTSGSEDWLVVPWLVSWGCWRCKL